MAHQAIVLANGSLTDAPRLRARLQGWAGAAVIAADGGLAHAQALGLTVGTVVGDLDSLDPPTRARLQRDDVRLEHHPAEKDETDLELALLTAVRQGADAIAILGAWGGRLDMSIANLLLLLHPALAGIRVELWDGDQTAWVLRPPGGEVGGSPGDTLSLIPLGEEATGVTTAGLAYPLRGETLPIGPARGVSNVLEAAQASVRLTAGALLAIHSPGRA